ncbi:MAG: peptidoglycan DD-metalloendopeptidase family protein [Anaerolineales bacterium]|nr:peptidoglycan DD-metalloendopeptidase family protein [Anaerolineales bacterium]
MSLKLVTCTALVFFTAGCGPAVISDSAQVSQAPASATPAPTPTPLPPPPTSEPVVMVATQIVSTASEPVPTAPEPAPAIEAMPIPTPAGPPFSYHVIEEGETLGYISWLYDTPLEELVALNKLAGPDAIIQTGQSLRIPLRLETTSPQQMLLPDSEVVYSPAYAGFNIPEFIGSKGGYLLGYTEYVDGRVLTGAEIVELVAQQFSVGPRLLLALLEHYGGWVTNPYPSAGAINRMLGPQNPRGSSLYLALGWTANRINAGYYGYKRDGFWVFSLADRQRAITPEGLNAGTVGVQNILALHSDQETWAKELGPDGLLADYRALFGDPLAHPIEPLIPKSLVQPPLSLPWAKGQGFYITSGPHPAYADGSAWASIDFGPPDVLGNCFYSAEPNTAAADGVIVVVRHGAVELDLDGDGNIQTGWVLQYLHVVLDADKPVQVGQRVKAGDIIGYASCEGGLANSSHLHFSRRYNGEWIDAGGPVPMNLSGWVVQPTLIAYEGTLKNGSDLREACECWEPEQNLIVNQ